MCRYNWDKCNSFIPYDGLTRCQYDEVNKECTELSCVRTDISNCGAYTPVNNNKKCSLNSNTNKCEEVVKEDNKTNRALRIECIKYSLIIILLLLI